MSTQALPAPLPAPAEAGVGADGGRCCRAARRRI